MSEPKEPKKEKKSKTEILHYDRTKPVEETTVEELKGMIEEWKRLRGMK